MGEGGVLYCIRDCLGRVGWRQSRVEAELGVLVATTIGTRENPFLLFFFPFFLSFFSEISKGFKHVGMSTNTTRLKAYGYKLSRLSFFKFLCFFGHNNYCHGLTVQQRFHSV